MATMPSLFSRALRAVQSRVSPRHALAALAWAALAPAVQAATMLPAEARQALQRAAIPLDGIAVVVQELGRDSAVLRWRADEPMNPASVMKLPTTLAALDRLGPAFTWATPMWLTGPLKDGVLEGDLVIQGRGDPKLRSEERRVGKEC